MKQIIIICILACCLVGCATPSTTESSLPTFDEATCISYIGNGSNTVTGQAFATTRGGDVKYAAGKEVYLMPATDYFLKMAGRDFKGMDERAKKYIQKTFGDGTGTYAFTELRDGPYLVVTYLYWSTGSGTTGSMLFGIGEVSGGSVAKIMVNRIP